MPLDLPPNLKIADLDAIERERIFNDVSRRVRDGEEVNAGELSTALEILQFNRGQRRTSPKGRIKTKTKKQTREEAQAELDAILADDT